VPQPYSNQNIYTNVTDQDTTWLRWHYDTVLDGHPAVPAPPEMAQHPSPPILIHVYCSQMVTHISYCWALNLVLYVVSSSGSNRLLALKCKEKRADRCDLAFMKLCYHSSDIWLTARHWPDASASDPSTDWKWKLPLKYERLNTRFFMTNNAVNQWCHQKFSFVRRQSRKEGSL